MGLSLFTLVFDLYWTNCLCLCGMDSSDVLQESCRPRRRPTALQASLTQRNK